MLSVFRYFTFFQNVILVLKLNRTALLSHKHRAAGVKGEEIIPEFKLSALFSSLPDFLKSALYYVYLLIGEKRKARVLSKALPVSASRFL